MQPKPGNASTCAYVTVSRGKVQRNLARGAFDVCTSENTKMMASLSFMVRRGRCWTLLAIALLLPSFVLADAPARPNVLLIVTDDQRADTIHALGNQQIETPNLDRLVSHGATFRHAISPNPLCRPARAELMTGVSSFRNGVPGSGTLDSKLVTWAETMRRAGYRTWHVGKWDSGGRPHDHGFEESSGLFAGGGRNLPQTFPVDASGHKVTGYVGYVFQDDDGHKFPERGVGLTPTMSATLADSAIELLRREDDRPFFLQLNFTAPHDPLLVPPGLDQRYGPHDIPLPKNFLPEHPFDHGNLRGRDEQLWPWPRTPELVQADLAHYYAVLTDLDRQIGRVIATLETAGQLQRTLIIFTSDQGLAIGSHGLRGKQNMYEHTITTPLVLAGPGVPEGKSFDAQVYLRDLYPTVCKLVGLPAPTGIDGRSLTPLLNGTAQAIHEVAFTYFGDVERAVRTDRWKLIYYPKLERYQLFDLQADADERHDLIDKPAHADTVADLKQKLAELRAAAGDSTLGIASEAKR